MGRNSTFRRRLLSLQMIRRMTSKIYQFSKSRSVYPGSSWGVCLRKLRSRYGYTVQFGLVPLCSPHSTRLWHGLTRVRTKIPQPASNVRTVFYIGVYDK